MSKLLKAFPIILKSFYLIKAKIWSILAFEPGFEARKKFGRAFQKSRAFVLISENLTSGPGLRAQVNAHSNSRCDLLECDRGRAEVGSKLSVFELFLVSIIDLELGLDS